MTPVTLFIVTTWFECELNYQSDGGKNWKGWPTQ